MNPVPVIYPILYLPATSAPPKQNTTPTITHTNLPTPPKRANTMSQTTTTTPINGKRHPSVNGELHFEYDFFYSEIPLEYYIGPNQTSASEVLHTLLQDRRLRRTILNERANAHPREWRAAHLIHPLLKLPLYLDFYDNDEDFLRKIKRYLELEQIVKWTI
jgi:hypothetical protein